VDFYLIFTQSFLGPIEVLHYRITCPVLFCITFFVAPFVTESLSRASYQSRATLFNSNYVDRVDATTCVLLQQDCTSSLNIIKYLDYFFRIVCFRNHLESL